MIVEWIPQNEYASEFIPPPKPAKNYIPEWYKNMPPFAGGQTPTIKDHCRADATEKLCMPLMDTFTVGYIQESWCDVHIRIDDDGNRKVIQANTSEQLITDRIERNYIIPDNSNNEDLHINWVTQWEPKTPKGWSTYYSHPFNQYDVPFRTIDGIIDTDRWWIGGSIPFVLKKGFEGVIPKGTPIYQMIFFKRENWKSKILKYNDIKNDRQKLYDKVFNHFHSGYRKNIWIKKSYE